MLTLERAIKITQRRTGCNCGHHSAWLPEERLRVFEEQEALHMVLVAAQIVADKSLPETRRFGRRSSDVAL